MAPPAPTARKIRVVVAKPGLDGHDRGAKIIARALRDAGMEVIYTGLHQTPEQIVETVIQEDADAVGLSILSGAHMTLVPRIVELLKEQGVDDVLLTVGGTIPGDDIAPSSSSSAWPRSSRPARRRRTSSTSSRALSGTASAASAARQPPRSHRTSLALEQESYTRDVRGRGGGCGYRLTRQSIRVGSRTFVCQRRP